MDICIQDDYCSEPDVQPLWGQAALLLDEAKADLERVLRPLQAKDWTAAL